VWWVVVPKKRTMKMICDQGCLPTAEKRISKSQYAELSACLLIFDHVLRAVSNVDPLDNSVQNTIVTITGYVMMVENRTVCANWKGRYHLLRGDFPVRAYHNVWNEAKRK
jgi:hypothetical protein